VPAATLAARAALLQAALKGGPDGLSPRQKNALLDDPLTLSQLHFDIWNSEQANRRWQSLLAVTAATAAATP
jgi:membrane glycosyltransferase